MNDLTDISPIRAPELALAPEAAPEPGFQPFGEDGFTFFDFLDIINPLQHIPLISNIYRDMTGDTLDAAPRVLGGTLFGGPIGAVASVISVIVEEGTGKDPGDHLLALLDDDAVDAGEDVDNTDDVEEIAQFGTAAGEATDEMNGPVVETTLAELNILRIEAGLPPVPVGAPPAELVAETPVYPAPPAVLAFPSPGQASTDGRGSPPPSQGFLPWFSGQADAPAPPALAARQTEAPGRQATSAAIAPSGGWFSDVMLTALSRYEESAKLSDATAARRLNITN